MSRVIWKFELETRVPRTTIRVRFGVKPLHVAVQRGVPCLWVELDPEDTPTSMVVTLVATGQELPEWAINYVGTFLVDDGNYVWHVYTSWIPDDPPALVALDALDAALNATVTASGYLTP